MIMLMRLLWLHNSLLSLSSPTSSLFPNYSLSFPTSTRRIMVQHINPLTLRQTGGWSCPSLVATYSCDIAAASLSLITCDYLICCSRLSSRCRRRTNLSFGLLCCAAIVASLHIVHHSPSPCRPAQPISRMPWVSGQLSVSTHDADKPEKDSQRDPAGEHQQTIRIYRVMAPVTLVLALIKRKFVGVHNSRLYQESLV